VDIYQNRSKPPPNTGLVGFPHEVISNGAAGPINPSSSNVGYSHLTVFQPF